MADTVSNKVLYQDAKRLVTKHNFVYVDTGESNAVKIDKSTLTSFDGTEPGNLYIEKIDYIVNGLNLTISLDATSDVVIDTIGASIGGANGCIDYRSFGGINTTATGDTGDVLFTTSQAAAGDSYDITLWLRKAN